MIIDMRISDDCRRLARTLAQRRGAGLHSVLGPFLARFGRNKTDRLLHDRDNGNRRRLIWPSAAVELLAEITAGVTPFAAVDVLACLVDPAKPVDPELQELVRRSEFHLHASATQKAMVDKIYKCTRGAKKVVSCEGPLRLDVNSEDVIEAQVCNEQKFWGYGPDRARYRASSAVERHTEVIEDYGSAKVITAQRSAFYDDLGACRGVFADLDPDHAIESRSDFAFTFVDELGVDYRVIDESKLSPELNRWAGRYDSIMAFDDRVIMYAREAGAKRTFLEKTGDPVRDRLFDDELQRLYTVIDPKFLRHVPTQRAVMEMLAVDTDTIDQQRKQILAEKVGRGEQAKWGHQSSERTGAPVNLPGR